MQLQPQPQPPPLSLPAVASSRAGTPTGGLAELREAQGGTAEALQLVSEEVERQGDVQTQIVQTLAVLQLEVESLPAVLEECFARLEVRQAAVEQRLEAGAGGSAAAAPPGQASAAAAAAAAAAGRAATEARFPRTSAASSAVLVRRPQGQRIRIGDHCFASLDDVRALIKQLKRDLLDRPVRADSEEHGPIFRFLEDLLSRHPKGAAKVQHPPVMGFVARVNGYNSGVEFRFIDACYNEHDFSTQKCLKQREASPTVKLARAMAAAVQDYKAAFWWSCTSLFCPLCGAADTAELVVDHDCPTFPQLRARFMATCRLPAPRQFVEDPQTNAQVFRAEDSEFVELWRRYHKQHARLRLLCVTCLRLENKRRGIPQCKGPLLSD